MPNTGASVNTKFRFDANDFHITKALETGLGKHTLTAGVYYSSYRLDKTQLLNAILTNVQTRPLALDVQALNSSGQVVGSVTENGFIAYGNGSQNGRVRGHSFAFYVADTWQITRSEENTSALQSLMRNSYADFCLKK